MSWSAEEARALADGIFALSKAPECEVAAELTESDHTRFAANDVTTSGIARDAVISITSRGAGRSGNVRVNETDPESLKRAVERSEALMAVAPVDPEFVEGLPAQTYPAIPAWHDATAGATARTRCDGVKAALDRSRGKGLEASGYFETTARWTM